MLYKHGNLRATAKIGLEVHAQLSIRSKLFSQGLNSSRLRSNSQLDLLDIAMPGSLPKLNKNALKSAIISSIGLNCKVQNFTHFDRKNYFYTDMPAGFQLTQYNNPIAKDGFIEFIVRTHHKSLVSHSQRYDVVKYLYHEDRADVEEFEPYIKRSRIKQVQLEQDSAKTLIHSSQEANESELCNLVDYNRSGVGLIEIVFEPDLTSHHEATSLVKELIYTLKVLRTCDCELQDGSLRVDANVSIQKLDDKEIDSARVELKNLNSLKALGKGIEYEIQRQTELVASGNLVIQETRTFDSKSSSTKPLRMKEQTVDYRYVPEPSIPPLTIDQQMIEEIKATLPAKMAKDLRDILTQNHKLGLILTSEVLDEPGMAEYLIEILEERPSYDPNVIADFLIYAINNLKDLLGSSYNVDLVNLDSRFLTLFNVDVMRSILDLMIEDEINFATAYELMKYIFTCNNLNLKPREIVDKFNWSQIRDRKSVLKLCIDLTKGMKNTSKKYAKTGHKKYLRLMLNKLSELTQDRVSIKVAIEVLDSILKPSKQGS